MKRIEIKNIEFSYEDKKILNGFNCELNAGELVGILGANGSGKSTLLKLITGFYKKENGKILYDGEEQEKIKIERLSKKISLITQKANQNLRFTVKELLELGRVPHIKNHLKGLERKDYDIIENVIKELNLKKFLKRDVKSLSVGEFQKVLLGRALIQEGKAIFLDEPTSALDINHALDFLEILRKKIKEKNLIGVLVIHDINLAALFCDRIIFLKDGKNYIEGIANTILNEKNLLAVYGFIPKLIKDNENIYVLPKRS